MGVSISSSSSRLRLRLTLNRVNLAAAARGSAALRVECDERCIYYGVLFRSGLES